MHFVSQVNRSLKMADIHFVAAITGLPHAMEMVRDYIVAGIYHLFDTAANCWWTISLRRGCIISCIRGSQTCNVDWIPLVASCGKLVLLPSGRRKTTTPRRPDEKKSQT